MAGGPRARPARRSSATARSRSAAEGTPRLPRLPFLQNRRQIRSRRHALRRRRTRTRREIRRETLRHGPADLGVELLHPSQVLANGEPQTIGNRRQIKPREPPGQPRWRRGNEARPREGHSFPYDERPGEHVTEPPPARGHQRRNDGDDAQRHQNLDHAYEATHQRVPEPDRSAVVAHHPQPAGKLPERAPVAERLDRDRPADQQQNEHRDRQRGLRRLVQRSGGRHHTNGDDDVGDHGHSQIEQHGQCPAGQLRGAQLQRHRLPRDQLTHAVRPSPDLPLEWPVCQAEGASRRSTTS